MDQLPDPLGVARETSAVDQRARLEAMLALLPTRQRTVGVLHYYQDLRRLLPDAVQPVE